MTKTEFYQVHLNRVSRSFAFCIEQLQEPIRNWTALSYLICRILDTIEDSPWKKLEDKESFFKLFDEALFEEIKNEDWNLYLSKLPKDVSEGEMLLMNDSLEILKDIGKLDPPIRSAIQNRVITMSKGMQLFQKRHPFGIQIKSHSETNEYCYYVAGVVGELLTDFLYELKIIDNLKHDKVEVYRLSVEFGLFLQKINILKDELYDAQEKRRFIADLNQFKSGLYKNSHGAIQFLQLVPTDRRDFRLFCGWSLFLGISSLKWINSFSSVSTNIKLPRNIAELICKQVTDSIDDNQKIVELFEELIPRPENSSSIEKYA